MSEVVYTEADLRDLAVARDIADRSIRIRLDLNLGDYDRTINLDVAHLLAAALVRVQYAPDLWCPECSAQSGFAHDDHCLVGRALAAWMSGKVTE